MIKTGKRIKRRRLFSEELKLQIVNSYESGQLTVLELSKEYQVGKQTIYRWIYKYSKFNKKSIQLVEVKDSQQERLKDYEKRIKELEQALGRKQMSLDYLEKMIELASDHFNTDIKKNFDTPHSGGSKKTKRS